MTYDAHIYLRHRYQMRRRAIPILVIVDGHTRAAWRSSPVQVRAPARGVSSLDLAGKAADPPFLPVIFYGGDA